MKLAKWFLILFGASASAASQRLSELLDRLLVRTVELRVRSVDPLDANPVQLEELGEPLTGSRGGLFVDGRVRDLDGRLSAFVASPSAIRSVA